MLPAVAVEEEQVLLVLQEENLLAFLLDGLHQLVEILQVLLLGIHQILHDGAVLRVRLLGSHLPELLVLRGQLGSIPRNHDPCELAQGEEVGTRGLHLLAAHKVLATNACCLLQHLFGRRLLG